MVMVAVTERVTTIHVMINGALFILVLFVYILILLSFQPFTFSSQWKNQTQSRINSRLKENDEEKRSKWRQKSHFFIFSKSIVEKFQSSFKWLACSHNTAQLTRWYALHTAMRSIHVKGSTMQNLDGSTDVKRMPLKEMISIIWKLSL